MDTVDYQHWGVFAATLAQNRINNRVECPGDGSETAEELRVFEP
jgi:hypothetical protein